MALMDVISTLIEDLDFESEDSSLNSSQNTRSKPKKDSSRVNTNHRGSVKPGTASYVAKSGGFGQNKNAKQQYKRLQKGVTLGPARGAQVGGRIVDQLKPWLTEGVKKP